MRRYTFYLSIALSAFGIGLFVVFDSFFKHAEPSVIAQVTNSNVEANRNFSVNAKTKQPEFVEIKLKNLPCKDEILQIVWREMDNEIAQINAERAGKFKSCEDFLEVEDYLQTNKEMDLNSDGVKEIFIRGTENPFSRCGNNCYTYWIFQKTKGKNYKKLFEAEGYLPVIKSKKTVGYKDIMFEVYARDIESGNILYQYNGTEYVPKRCWSESLLYKGKGTDLVLGKKYHTEYYKCEESGYITNYRKQVDSQ